MMHNSMSLRPTEKIQYETLRTQFSKLHPAATPPQKVEFQPPPYCKVIDSESKQPVTITSEVTEIVGWPSDDGSKIRFEISTPAENLNPFWKWLNATFGVDGLIADSLETNYTAMVGKNKPAGVVHKRLREFIDKDLACASGQKPLAFPQQIKVWEDEDGNKFLKFKFNHYLRDKSSTRSGPTIQEDVVNAFISMPDHPLMQFAEANPTAVIKAPVITVAHNPEGQPVTAMEAFAAGMRKTSKGTYMFKALGTVTVGGLGYRFSADRKVFVASAFLNNGGIRIYAIPSTGSAPEIVNDVKDTAVYMSAAALAAPDDPPAKRARVGSESSE